MHKTLLVLASLVMPNLERTFVILHNVKTDVDMHKSSIKSYLYIAGNDVVECFLVTCELLVELRYQFLVREIRNKSKPATYNNVRLPEGSLSLDYIPKSNLNLTKSRSAAWPVKRIGFSYLLFDFELPTLDFSQSPITRCGYSNESQKHKSLKGILEFLTRLTTIRILVSLGSFQGLRHLLALSFQLFGCIEHSFGGGLKNLIYIRNDVFELSGFV